MKREHYLQAIPSANSDSVVVGADANTDTSTGAFWSLASTVMESTGGLGRKKNVTILPNSPIATMSTAELKEGGLTFHYPNASSVDVSFFQVESRLVATLTSRNHQTFSVELPQRISERKKLRSFDLDYTIQLLVRGFIGENTTNGSRETAIKDVWRKFRTYIKHRKNYVR